MKTLAIAVVLLSSLAFAQFEPPAVVLTTGSSLGPGCTLTATGIKCTTVAADQLDAGVANVVGPFQANGGQLETTASGVFVRNDFTVTTGNDAIFSRHARVNGDFKIAGAVTDSSTTIAIASGGCTSPSIVNTNGTAYMEITIGTSCTGVKTFTLTMPTVATGYQCSARNKTAARKDNVVRHSDGSTTTVIITNYGTSAATPADWTAGDVIAVACRGG